MHLLQTGGSGLTDADLVELYPRQPGLRVNFVTSLDGAVAIDGLSEKLSSSADKRVFRLLRMLCDVLLVGAGTLRREQRRPLLLDEHRRQWRREHSLTEWPRLVIVTHSLDLDPDLPVFAQAPVLPLIVTHEQAPVERRKALESVAEIVTYGHSEVDVRAVVTHLAGQAILCEGGPMLMGALTEADAIDELCLTMSALLAGPGAGRITAGTSTDSRPMRLAHALVEDDTLLLRYTRNGDST